MKFIVDAALSPRVSAALLDAGHDAVHVLDYGMLSARDSDVLARALAEERVIVSADTDFAMLLAQSGAERPSFILFRHPIPPADRQSARILAALPDIEAALNDGCVVAFEESRIRIRSLPINEYRDE